MALAIVAVTVLVVWRPWQTRPAASSASVAAAAPLTEAQKFVAQMWAIYDKVDDATQDEWALGEEIGERATKLEPLNAEAWAVYANVVFMPYVFGTDMSAERLNRAMKAAERALSLAPKLTDARLAVANVYRFGDDTARAEAEKIVRELLGTEPENRRVLRMAGNVFRYVRKFDEALAVLARLAALPGGDPVAFYGRSRVLMLMGRFVEAKEAIEQAAAAGAGATLPLRRFEMLLSVDDDLDAAEAMLAKVPASFLQREGGASLAYTLWLWRHDADKCVTVLNRFPGEVLFGTPKGILAGMAYQAGGRAAAARLEWQAALQKVEARLAAAPSQGDLLQQKIFLLAALGHKAEAEELLATYEQMMPSGNVARVMVGDTSRLPADRFEKALLMMTLGRTDEALDLIEASMTETMAPLVLLERGGRLRHHPLFDPVRATPRFQAMLAQLAAGSTPATGEKNPAGKSVPADKPAIPDKSLVVLPLENLSPDPENAFFTDGMHSEIIATLQRTLPDMKVTPRVSALHFKDSKLTLAEIGRQLGVANVITGSVRRAGNQVSIHLDLLRAQDATLLWSPDFNREVKDAIAIQNEIAAKVAQLFQAREQSGAAAIARLYTFDPKAYDLFLKALKLFQAIEQDAGAAKRCALLTEALTLDPNFGIAANYLSAAHIYASWAETNLAKKRAHEAEAKRWAEAAVRLTPGVGDGTMAYYLVTVEHDGVRALALARNAVRTLPNDAEALTNVGVALMGLGRMDEAVEVNRRAMELDPFSRDPVLNCMSCLTLLRRADAWEPLSQRVVAEGWRTARVAQHRYTLRGEIPVDLDSGPATDRVNWLLRARRWDAALETATKAAAEPERSLLSRARLFCRQAEALQQLGRDAEAVAAGKAAVSGFEQHRDQGGELSEHDWIWALMAAGRMDEALVAAGAALKETAQSNMVAERWPREENIARVAARAGRVRESVTRIKRLLEQPSGLTVPILRAEFDWDRLRDDAEFQALLADPKNSAPL